MRLNKSNQPKQFLKRVLPLLFLLSPCLMAIGKERPSAAVPAADSVYVFHFFAENDMFYIPWQGNDVKLLRLCRLVEAHRAAIGAGTLPVRVDSYCVSLPTDKENLATAFVRANRVKSELITRQGLKEEDFVTTNYARAYLNHKDAVVVTLRIPASVAAVPADTVMPGEAGDSRAQGTSPVIDSSAIASDSSVNASDSSVILSETKDLRPQRSGQEMLHSVQHDRGRSGQEMLHSVQHDRGRSGQEMLHSVQHDSRADAPYCLALRTNLLYDAMLLPTLGVEWRVNHRWGVRLDGSLSHWDGDRGKVQKIWMLSPEVRYYLLHDRRFYVGVSANYAEYNLYGYLPGKFLPDDTGYQGHLWSAGLSAGYHLPLWRCLSADFNLGLGYTRSAYDSFTAPYGVRVIKQRDRKKNLWGPTQAGVTISYRLKAN